MLVPGYYYRKRTKGEVRVLKCLIVGLENVFTDQKNSYVLLCNVFLSTYIHVVGFTKPCNRCISSNPFHPQIAVPPVLTLGIINDQLYIVYWYDKEETTEHNYRREYTLT